MSRAMFPGTSYLLYSLSCRTIVAASCPAAAAFQSDPQGKVPDLHPEAAAMFQSMSPAELQVLLEVDEKMETAGFTVGSGNISVRMV